MARRKSSRSRKGRAINWAWWTSMEAGGQRRALRLGAFTIVLAVFVIGFVFGARRLEARVNRQLAASVEEVSLTFLEVPELHQSLALGELRQAVSDLLGRSWADDSLCQAVALRLEAVGWISQVHFVRRTPDARLEISASYRNPVAMVQQQSEFFLVDAEGVRLPGTYRYSPEWKVIQGVASPASKAGMAWEGVDLRAGLDVIRAIAHERFSHQMTGVLVENVGGRVDAASSHIELATDRAGGRIRWGSAPGYEIEENSVAQKLAILRENYRRTGRADAQHAVIDISSLPNGFTIPG